MTRNELFDEYWKMCNSHKCEECKYNETPCSLYFGYERGIEEVEKQIKEVCEGQDNLIPFGIWQIIHNLKEMNSIENR